MKYPDFQIDWLRALVAVVDAGSLSAAAPLLHRSQSAVSMQIKKLESVLGKPVLLRGPRHMEITGFSSGLVAGAGACGGRGFAGGGRSFVESFPVRCENANKEA